MEEGSKLTYTQAEADALLAAHAAVTITHGATDAIADQADIATHAADLDAHTRNDLEIIRTGAYYFYPGGLSASVTMVVNQLYATPIIIARNMTIDEIAIDIVTQAGQKLMFGIYGIGTNWYPGALLKDLGEITLDGTGIKTVAISPALALTKGAIFVVAISNGTPTVKGINAGTSYNGFFGMSATNFTYTNACAIKALIYPASMPNPFTAGGSFDPSNALITPLHIVSLD